MIMSAITEGVNRVSLNRKREQQEVASKMMVEVF
jgi:hypothetical protein